MISAIGNNNYQSRYKQNTAFNGHIATKATDAISWGIKRIETGGILVDFLFVDVLGMVIPRTYQAFQRNKEELGHTNYKSGFEELIREIFSGPSMFVIPMAFIALSKKLFGTASKIQFKTLDSLHETFKDLVKDNKEIGDKTKLKKDFYRKIINEAFEEHRKANLDQNLDKKIDEIVEHLSNIENTRDSKASIAEIKRIVSDLNKAHGQHLDYSHNVTLKSGITKEVVALTTDLTNYSKDVIEIIANKAKETEHGLLPSLLEKVHRSKVIGRRTILASAFLSTLAFLYAVPIMYKRNKQFPGIDGLVKENNITQPSHNVSFKNDKNINKNDVFKAFINTQPNNTPSFGSSASSVTNKLFKKFDFNGHNVPHAILGVYTLGMMLGARLLQARNADERREVATRDFSGLTTIVFALPVFRNIISTISRKISGFAISQKLASIKNHFNPTQKPYTFENLSDIYSEVSKYKNNIVDFSENISSQGGDLRKIFDFLSNDSKKALNEIANGVSTNNEQVKPNRIFKFLTKPFRAGNDALILPKSNEEIINLFKTAQVQEKYKPLLQIIINEIDKQGNHLVKFAEALKSIPEAVSIVAISGFLGWFLPWFNIHYTKKLYKNKEKESPKNQYSK